MEKQELQQTNEATNVETEAADNSQYIEAIKTLKNTTVSREEYERVKEEKNKLLNNFVNGVPNYQQKATTVGRSREELDKALFNGSNLEVAKAMIELKERIDAEDKVDNAYNARGKYAYNTPESIERNQQVYEGLKAMVEEAEGDAEYFNVLFNKNVK